MICSLQRFSYGIFLSLGVLILSSCNTKFEMDVFLSDVFLSENVEIPALVKVGIVSCDHRSEYEGEILKIFSPSSKARISGCSHDGINSVMIVSITAEITTGPSRKDIFLVREIHDDIEHLGNNYEVRSTRFSISSRLLERMQEFAAEQYQSISYDDVEIELFLHNDERRNIIVTSHNLWVDGKPYERYNSQSFSHREKIRLSFSNVTSDLLLQGHAPSVLIVSRQK